MKLNQSLGFVLLIVLSIPAPTEAQVQDCYCSITFRESPYSPVRGIHRLNENQAKTRNHYRFEYDKQGRLSEVSFRLGDQLRARNHTANYFWYASAERYRYEKNRVAVTYLDRFGLPTAVSGTVFQSVYQLDNLGRRVELKYLDQAGNEIENSWGISRYKWSHLKDGSILEDRFDCAGQPVSLRPGFEFQRIRLMYDVNGYNALMQFVDANGIVAKTDSGFSQDRFEISRHGELLHYNVLDEKGQASVVNHQGIARGNQTFTNFGYERVATYEDAKGSPAFNQHGWWRSQREYDTFGNMISNAFTDLEGNLSVNQKTGYAVAITQWHDDGLRRKSVALFDAKNEPVCHKTRGFHRIRFTYDEQNRLIQQQLFDDQMMPVDHATQGWHLKEFQYTQGNPKPNTKQSSLGELRNKRLQLMLSLLRDRSHVPGMSAAIFQNGVKVWSGVAGVADLEGHIAVTPSTRFRLASVSKVITAIALAQMVEAGSISLDQSIDQLWGVNSNASVAQLMCHTGGVSHYFANEQEQLNGEYESSQQALAAALPHITGRTPGSTYQYSTFGYTFVAALMEKVSGQTFVDIIEQMAREYGAPTISAFQSGDSTRNLTKYYRVGSGSVATAEPRNFSYAHAGAGIVATAEDVAKLASLYVSGDIVSVQTRERFFEIQNLNDGTPVSDRRFEVGVGWRKQTAGDGKTYFHHAGVTHGARSIVLVDPQTTASVVLLSNARWTSDMFGTAFALLKIQQNSARKIPAKICSPLQMSLNRQSSRLSLSSQGIHPGLDVWCSGLESELSQWLQKSGKGGRFQFVVSEFGDTLVSPYGLTALFRTEDGRMVGRLGSNDISIDL